jgi:hypothetical protein
MFRTGRPADWRLVGWMALVTVPYFALISAYDAWGGVWGPPGRYPATLLPLLAAPLAVGLWALARSRVYKGLYALLALPGFAFMAIMLYDARTMFPTETSRIYTWLVEDPASPLRIDLRPYIPLSALPDEVWHPWRSGGVLIASGLIVLLGLFLLGRQGRPVDPPRWPRRARFAVAGGTLALLGLGWLIMNGDFLKPKTLLQQQARWELPGPLHNPGDIAYLDGKIYIPSFGERHENTWDPGEVGAFDLKTGRYTPIQPISPTGAPLAWTHPGDIKVGPDGLLYVLNNGEGDQALYVMQPDGRVVRQIALERKTLLGVGLHVEDEGSLYVADQEQGLVLQYDAAGGDPLATIDGMGNILNNPRGVAVDSTGAIYTTESFKQIQQLDEEGRLVRLYQLRCRPRYFAAPSVEQDWLDVSCNTGLISLNTRGNYVQLVRVGDQDPPLRSPRGITYGPDNVLYALDETILTAYKVQH